MRVPVDPLREAVQQQQRQGRTLAPIARAAGMERRGVGDTVALKRAVGLSPYQIRGQQYVRQHMHQQTATRVCLALGLDPHEVGL